MVAEQPHRTIDADGAEHAQRETEAAEQESRVAERDDEPVPPSERLEELNFLDGRCGQLCLLLNQVPGPMSPRCACPARARGLIPVCIKLVNKRGA